MGVNPARRRVHTALGACFTVLGLATFSGGLAGCMRFKGEDFSPVRRRWQELGSDALGEVGLPRGDAVDALDDVLDGSVPEHEALAPARTAFRMFSSS